MTRADTGPEVLSDAADGTANGTLMPRPVRRALWVTLGVVLAAAMYLISVRGTAIIFDIATAVGSFCF